MSEVKVRRDEHFVHGSNGEILREYDDVTLLQPINESKPGNVTVDVIPAGTRATIIMILEGNNRVHLECYVGEKGFVFAEELGNQLQLHRRREDKLKNA